MCHKRAFNGLNLRQNIFVFAFSYTFNPLLRRNQGCKEFLLLLSVIDVPLLGRSLPGIVYLIKTFTVTGE